MEVANFIAQEQEPSVFERTLKGLWKDKVFIHFLKDKQPGLEQTTSKNRQPLYKFFNLKKNLVFWSINIQHRFSRSHTYIISLFREIWKICQFEFRNENFFIQNFFFIWSFLGLGWAATKNALVPWLINNDWHGQSPLLQELIWRMPERKELRKPVYCTVVSTAPHDTLASVSLEFPAGSLSSSQYRRHLHWHSHSGILKDNRLAGPHKETRRIHALIMTTLLFAFWWAGMLE